MSDLDELRTELDRVGVSYARAGAAAYVAVHDLGDEVWFRGPPLSGLTWKGPPDRALELVRQVDDDVGVDEFWRALERVRLDPG